MTILQSILLGIVQGLTEFLPISSSGHLVLVPYLLGWDLAEEQVFLFDVLVQMGTLAAVIAFFWRDIVNIVKAVVAGLISRRPFETFDSRLGWLLVLATIPAGLFGILIKDQVEAAFNSPTATAYFLILTAFLLILAEWVGKRRRPLTSMNWLDALIMGTFQALSVFPGISRSGSTITGGMIRNLERPAAARFSFLMSIPVMVAAGLLATLDMFDRGLAADALPVFIPGVLTAALVGYLSIRWLLAFLVKRPLYIFSGYCILLGALVIFTASSAPETSASVAEPAVLQVQLATELSLMEPDIRGCAQGAAVFIDLVPEPAPADVDLAVRLGEPLEPAPFAAQVGEETITFITAAGSTLDEIRVEEIRSLYQGTVASWDQLGQAPGEPAIWTYPQGHPLEVKVAQTALASISTTSLAFLAPGSQAMVEAVADDPLAVGYTLESWLNEDVQPLELVGTGEGEMTLPVLALLNEEPEGVLRALISCLQER